MGRRRAPWLLVCVLFAHGARAESLPCREDDSLSETAAALLLSGAPITASALLGQARVHGFDGVAVHAREAGSEEALRTWLARLAQSGEGALVCGEARSEARRLVIASLRGGKLWREGDTVRAELEPGFSRPSLVVETVADEVVSIAVNARDLAAGVTLPATLEVRRVQLLAESASGPRPIAELTFAGSTNAPAPSLSPPSPAPAAASEAPGTLFAQLGAFRREAGVGALRENRLLADSAARHADRICALGTLAHRVAGEDPELRLRREHVVARTVGEVLARAESAAAAWRVLLASPSHRLALSRRDFTDVGIGQARDEKRRVCVVVLLAAWPRRAP